MPSHLFLAAAAILALTPGPGIMYVMARTLSGGARDGIASTLGTAIGGLIHVFGTQAYFGTLASLTGGLTLYDLWRKIRRKPVPAQQKGPFISAQPRA